ncbi:MAG: hypothetical protein KDA85_02255 [Planctomycetaceae bacterium]|nr:hypothetical protein [Planctomycetaceae bacterium]
MLLLILTETASLRWFVASVTRNGVAFPLLASAERDLAGYLDREIDEQVSFLRHRYCGVLQRGSDRIWGRQQKASNVLLIADAPFPSAFPEVTQRVAQNLVDWVSRPPLISAVAAADPDGVLSLQVLAGEDDPAAVELALSALPTLKQQMTQDSLWEQVPPAGNCKSEQTVS